MNATEAIKKINSELRAAKNKNRALEEKIKKLNDEKIFDRIKQSKSFEKAIQRLQDEMNEKEEQYNQKIKSLADELSEREKEYEELNEKFENLLETIELIDEIEEENK